MNLNKVFAANMNKIIEEQKITLEELAENTGIMLATLQAYSQAKCIPRANNIIKIAKGLNVTSDYLLGLTDKNTYTEFDCKTNDDTSDLKWTHEQYLKKLRIQKHCLHGMSHFCNGAVNKSMAKIGTKPIHECEYFINGVCTNPKINYEYKEIKRKDDEE